MWLYMLGGALVLVGIVVGAFGGGIFSIILIPLGVIALASAAAYAAWGRAAHRDAGAGTEAGQQPVSPLATGHAQPEDTPAPATPDELVDARREQQYR
ncbi:MAG TPA: hypothetical protein VKT31_03660 [Solirubrobacteraceae bacterium]|nr:hypothetical protein [Solirubrobacteraceae bacterium]